MITQINWQGWSNAYEIRNAHLRVVVTADVGPRIVFCGWLDGPNLLHTYADNMGKMGGEKFRLYGGHRLWHAPEDTIRTYYPDNAPVQVHQFDEYGLRLTAPIESTTGIQKSLEIRLTPDQASVTLTHDLTNLNLWEIELAAWALTIMTAGGCAILPLPPRGSHDEQLTPTGNLALWAYTNLTDERWTLGNEYILLRQKPILSPQKIGAWNPTGWLAYAQETALFIKTFSALPGQVYPDMGVNCECFTDQDMLELESLSPLTRLQPHTTLRHQETWHILPAVDLPQSEADVKNHIWPHIAPLLV
jgi:hypothetical protein